MSGDWRGRGRGRARGRARGQEGAWNQPQQQGQPRATPQGAWSQPLQQGAWSQPLQQGQPRATPHARPAAPPTQYLPPGLPPPDPTPKNVGRARGRARGQPQAEVADGQQQQVAGAVSRASYRGAEGGRSSTQRAPVQEVTEAMGAVSIGKEGDNGNGHEKSVGRGVMRGRREISNVIWTKPQTITEKKGMQGTAVNLIANYFNVVKKKDWKLCLYHVYFSPEEDRTGTRKRMLRQHTQALGNEYIFDGMQLYLPHKLGSEVTELASKREPDDAVYQVTIKFIKELSALDSQYLQITGILLRKCMDLLGLQLIGRNYFNPKAEARAEKYQIVIWPGFSTSIRQHEQSLLLNADVMHKFLRSQTAYEVIRETGQNYKQGALQALLGSVVMTKYNERTYRIDDIAFDVSPKDKFEYKGGEISYMEYYEKNYSIKIRDDRQPLLLSKPKKSDLRRGSGMIYLIPELCVMTGITDQMRNDFNMMKDLSQYMRMGPDKRVAALLRFNRDLVSNQEVKKELNNWGLHLAPNLVELQGRVLPQEQIAQGGNVINFDQRTSDWSRETRSLRLNIPINVQDWAMLFPSKFASDAKELTVSFFRVGKPMGMSFGEPKMINLRGDSTQEFINALNQLQGKQLVVLILPNNRLDRYSAIKRHLSLKMGIPSQCVLSKTLFKRQRLMSVATKIAIQINCKLGGEPWNVTIPIKNALVIGYDTYHDKLSRGSSYGGVVSSLNQSWTKYLSQVAQHKNQEELTNNFAAGVKNALTRYKSHNGRAPSYVIVYRDGVGEGQIEYVKEHEIDAIKRCFTMTCESMPKFAFVVVSKRITTRLLVGSGGGHCGNPSPGTVVDDVITLPERYDFYLISQSVNQGTVSPTSFNIIEDTTGLKPDHMQRLAYKLTHLYFNWQGTVRVPAPCMFAHKLAYLTGQSIGSAPHNNLLECLWYL